MTIKQLLGQLVDQLRAIKVTLAESRQFQPVQYQSTDQTANQTEALRVIAYELVRWRYEREGREWNPDEFKETAPLGYMWSGLSASTWSDESMPTGPAWTPKYDIEGNAAS